MLAVTGQRRYNFGTRTQVDHGGPAGKLLQEPLAKIPQPIILRTFVTVVIVHWRMHVYMNIWYVDVYNI